MLEIIWTNYFLEAQGYSNGETVVYQDNQSAILLARNGKMSSSKRTKHINIRYFFIYDQWSRGEFNVRFCLTDEMLGDYFTKLLQGKKFIGFRNRILGMNE